MFTELENSFHTFFYDSKEIIGLIKSENRKIYLAQQLEGFEFYQLIDNQNIANQLFKDLVNQTKVRFNSTE